MPPNNIVITIPGSFSLGASLLAAATTTLEPSINASKDADQSKESTNGIGNEASSKLSEEDKSGPRKMTNIPLMSVSFTRPGDRPKKKLNPAAEVGPTLTGLGFGSIAKPELKGDPVVGKAKEERVLKGILDGSLDRDTWKMNWSKPAEVAPPTAEAASKKPKRTVSQRFIAWLQASPAKKGHSLRKWSGRQYDALQLFLEEKTVKEIEQERARKKVRKQHALAMKELARKRREARKAGKTGSNGPPGTGHEVKPIKAYYTMMQQYQAEQANKASQETGGNGSAPISPSSEPTSEPTVANDKGKKPTVEQKRTRPNEQDTDVAESSHKPTESSLKPTLPTRLQNAFVSGKGDLRVEAIEEVIQGEIVEVR
ncbi:hypothetical protein BDZ91DRAFT_709552 [Kalaharituber pfeilii]|nr:hypothetical protein BDZ91DRAFT_709552 [Kalaharituber pfeilii]